MKRSWLLLIMLAAITGCMIQGLWAQQRDQTAFIVEVTYVTRAGDKMTEDISVFAIDPRSAEREAEAVFKARNTRHTFISASARIAANQPNNERDRDRQRNYQVEITFRTRDGQRMTEITTVEARNSRDAEREVEETFKRLNTWHTFVSARVR